MKLLVITTEKDISLPLIESACAASTKYSFSNLLYSAPLEEFKKKVKDTAPAIIYIRDPFNKGILDKNLENKLRYLLALKEVRLLDNLSDLKDIYLEDKWEQYLIYKDYMPYTELAANKSIANSVNVLYKQRISSRGRGIFFTTPADLSNLIVQERITIEKEYRIYSLDKKIYPQAGIRSSKTESNKVKINSTELVSPELMQFTEELDKLNKFEFVGYDIAELPDGTFKLIELNRSPQFQAFYQKSGINIFAEFLASRH